MPPKRRRGDSSGSPLSRYSDKNQSTYDPTYKGWGEGAFPHIDAQSCYEVWGVPSFETFSLWVPRAGTRPAPTVRTDALTTYTAA